jgi:hypothetical protein
MRYAAPRSQGALLVQADYLVSRGAERVSGTVHNVVEKQEMRFPDSINTSSSMSCVLHVRSFCVRSLHQQSALTIINELFTFAPVDG